MRVDDNEAAVRFVTDNEVRIDFAEQLKRRFRALLGRPLAPEFAIRLIDLTLIDASDDDEDDERGD